MSDSPEIKEVLDLRAEVANCRALLEEQRQQYADKCLELIDLREAKLREKQPLTRWTITGEEPDEENQRPGTMATPDPNGEWVSISDVHSLGTAYGALCQELEAVRRELDFFDRQHAAAMETVGELSDKVADRDARIVALETLVETLQAEDSFNG